MKYVMTQSQARYIQEQYGFLFLLGLNNKISPEPETRDQLLQRGVIYDNHGYDELHPAFRALFSCWDKMRYSVVRADLNRDTRFQCLLTNRSSTIFFDREGEQIRMDLIDFSEEKLDKFFAAVAELTPCGPVERPFTVTLSMEDYPRFINAATEEELLSWQKRLGLPASLLRTYLQAVLRQEDTRLLLVEDHISDVGYLMKLAPTDQGIFALKHVTYGTGEEKVVLVYGSDSYLIDSIYQF